MFIPDSPTCSSFIKCALAAAAVGAQGWLSLSPPPVLGLPEVWKEVT